MPLSTEWEQMGIGYTLASGRLFCGISDFHRFAEELLNRPVMTHELAGKPIWDEMRRRFEQGITDVLGPELPA